MTAPVGGESQVTVEAAAEPSASATRSFDTATVAPGGAGSGDDRGHRLRCLWRRSRKRCLQGFSYVSSSLTDEGEVTKVDDRTVRFALQGAVDKSFTYTVTASSTVGTYTFMGTLRNEDRVDSPVGGASSLRVGRLHRLRLEAVAGSVEAVSATVPPSSAKAPPRGEPWPRTPPLAPLWGIV